MTKIFNQVEKTHVGSNTFDLTHDRKFSGKMGNLIPTLVMEIIPGDKINISSSVMVRLAPLTAPVMHQAAAYMHYFFVPNRIVWKGWEEFITGGEDGESNPVWPFLELDYQDNDYLLSGGLFDYMGIPSADGNYSQGVKRYINALSFCAYNKIYNEYYRDQNLIDKFPDLLTDGMNEPEDYATLFKRAWQHDYFTSSLPFTQKGPSVGIPMAGFAQVRANTEAIENDENVGRQKLRPISNPFGVSDAETLETEFTTGYLRGSTSNPPLSFLDLEDSHIADLSTATAASIVDLRRAFKLQEWLEKNARGGSRYIESIAVHFGVKSSDQRQQRPEFIGGYKAPIKISEVLQTSESTEATPQGNMAGHGVAIGGNQGFAYRAEEHGYILGIMSVLPRSSYQQGIPKHFLKEDKYDYYWPEFAAIGEQAVLDTELYIPDDTLESGAEVFGYTPRYAEYKFIPSTVHGDFRTSLDFWHMGRIFASKPALNQDFIECDYTEFSRIFAVEDGTDHMWCHVLNTIKATRKMPVFGTPKM